MKKILSIFVVLTIFISLFVACSKTEEPTNESAREDKQEKMQEEETKTEENNKAVVLEEDDESKVSSLEEITLSYTSGQLDEETYHTSVLSLVTGDVFTGISESPTYRTNESMDPAKDAQWLMDNYESLDESGKTMVDHLTRIVPLSREISSFQLPFVIKSHASGTEDEAAYPIKIMENVYLTVPDTLATIPEAVETQVISDYLSNADLLGLPVGINHSAYRIVISMYYMPGPASSLSFLHRNIDFEGESLPTFYIHLDLGADSDTLKGALLHELFHAYQHEMGYERFTKHDNFMMESTAIWAVKHTDSNLQYPEKFDSYIYESDLRFNVEAMDDNLMKSWYQLPYMMVDELKDTDFVEVYLKSGLRTISLVETLNDTLGNPTSQNNVFARFGKYLVADVANSELDIPISAPYFSESIPANGYKEDSFEDFSSRIDGKSMSSFTMLAPGYYPVHINLSEYKDGILHIVSDAKALSAYNNAGLLVFYKKNNTWKVAIDGQMDSFRISELSFKDHDISELLFLFYSHDKEATDHSYSLIMQEKILGEGSINIVVDVDYKDPSDETIKEDIATYFLTITENIELMQSNNAETDLGMAAKFLTGDVYYVKDFEAIISGDRITEKLDGTGSHHSYSGQFRFNEGDPAEGELANALLGPDMSTIISSLFGNNSSAGLDLNSLLDASGIDMGGLDLGSLLGEEASSDLNQELADARAELGEIDMDSINMFMPNPNKLMRIKSVLQNETFHLYPYLPTKLESTEWVNVETVRKFKDDDGNIKSETSNTTSTLVFDALPLWFRNPHYTPVDPNELMLQFPQDPAAYALDNTSFESNMDQIMIFNGKYDETNLYNAFDDGVYSFNLEEISTKVGTQTQEMFLSNEDTFNGIITGNYTDASDSRYSVEIEIKYKYK